MTPQHRCETLYCMLHNIADNFFNRLVHTIYTQYDKLTPYLFSISTPHDTVISEKSKNKRTIVTQFYNEVKNEHQHFLCVFSYLQTFQSLLFCELL